MHYDSLLVEPENEVVSYFGLVPRRKRCIPYHSMSCLGTADLLLVVFESITSGVGRDRGKTQSNGRVQLFLLERFVHRFWDLRREGFGR
tara:strand:+ start:174 stop:440 length:267 start_codon:yes stop_codon:yes gene_type:complete